jgi:hypothetical protein
MTTLVNSPTLGLERVGRETLIILMETLNDELANQDVIWAPLDEDLANRRGVPYSPITLETIAPENFHLGHRPSLIEAPVEGYPNVSVITDRAGPSPFEAADQMDDYMLRLAVEIMVKSIDSEEEVNARVQRMADAVNVCVMSNVTMRGVFNEITDTPTVLLTEVFPRKENTSYGATFMWQGARIEYPVLKEASKPLGMSARPASVQAPAMVGAGIDQS